MCVVERKGGRERKGESTRERACVCESEPESESKRENKRERMRKKDKRGERKREKKGNSVGLVSTFPYSEYVMSQMCVRHVA